MGRVLPGQAGAHAWVAFIAVLAVVPLFGCGSKYSFSALPQASTNAPSNPITQGVQKFKPALAIRGIECLLCHAQVSANIISDFGNGDSFFFGTSANGGTGSKIYGNLPWYGDYYGTWQLATSLAGSVFIPKANLADSGFLGWLGSTWAAADGGGSPALPSPLTLAGYMQLNMPTSFYNGDPTAGAGPQVSANAQITEVSSVYIGAPTAAELTTQMTAPSAPWEAIGGAVSGLTLQGGYVMNSPGQPLACTGDVIVNAPLLLANVEVQTDSNGCRIYATQTIFIQGQITYTSTASTENLQLSSARGIMMGFSYDPTDTSPGDPSQGDIRSTLGYRLTGTNWYVDSQPLTRAALTSSNTAVNQAILADAALVSGSLNDSADSSACPTQMLTYTGYNGGNSATVLTQCEIDYTRLLLNAPNIQSRYVGQVSGVVIAEIALFAPGALNFQYDSTFDHVAELPLLGSSVLNIQQ